MNGITDYHRCTGWLAWCGSIREGFLEEEVPKTKYVLYIWEMHIIIAIIIA